LSSLSPCSAIPLVETFGCGGPGRALMILFFTVDPLEGFFPIPLFAILALELAADLLTRFFELWGFYRIFFFCINSLPSLLRFFSV